MRLKTTLILCLIALPGVSSALSPKPLPELQTIGEEKYHIVEKNDTLFDIARNNNLGTSELMDANPDAKPKQLWVGEKLFVPSLHLTPETINNGIIINLAELRLYYFKDGILAESHPVGTGRESSNTPLGQTFITKKRTDPVWRPTPAIRIEQPTLPKEILPGPDNPLGKFALNLGWYGFAMHGTNIPWSIGREVTHGCIRLYPEDIENLFNEVEIGTKVRIINKPIIIGWMGRNLYLEINRSSLTKEEIIQKIEAELNGINYDISWYAIEIAAEKQDGVPMIIATRPAPPYCPPDYDCSNTYYGPYMSPMMERMGSTETKAENSKL